MINIDNSKLKTGQKYFYSALLIASLLLFSGSVLGSTSSLDLNSGSFNDTEVSNGNLTLEVAGAAPEEQWKFTGHGYHVLDVAFGPSAVYSAGSYGDNTVRKVNASTGNQIWKFSGHSSGVYGVAVGPDGGVYSAADDYTLRKVNASTGNQIWKFTGHSELVHDVAVGLDGGVYSGGGYGDATVRKVNASTGNQIWKFTGHVSTASVYGVAVGPDGNVYSGSRDESVRKINGSTGNQIWKFTGHYGRVRDVAVGPEGDVYSASYDDTVRKINGSTGNQIWKFTGHSSGVYGVAVGPDGGVYSGAEDFTMRKINGSTGDEVWKFDGHSDRVHGVAVGSEGDVYSGSYDDTVRKVSEVPEYASSGSVVYDLVRSEEVSWDFLDLNVSLSGENVSVTVNSSGSSQSFSPGEFSSGENRLGLDGVSASKNLTVNISFNSNSTTASPEISGLDVLSDNYPNLDNDSFVPDRIVPGELVDVGVQVNTTYGVDKVLLNVTNLSDSSAVVEDELLTNDVGDGFYNSSDVFKADSAGTKYRFEILFVDSEGTNESLTLNRTVRDFSVASSKDNEAYDPRGNVGVSGFAGFTPNGDNVTGAKVEVISQGKLLNAEEALSLESSSDWQSGTISNLGTSADSAGLEITSIEPQREWSTEINESVNDATVSPVDGSVYAALGNGSIARVSSSGSVESVKNFFSDSIAEISLSKNSAGTLYAGSQDGVLKRVDYLNGQTDDSVNAVNENLTALEINSAGETYVSSTSGQVKRIDWTGSQFTEEWSKTYSGSVNEIDLVQENLLIGLSKGAFQSLKKSSGSLAYNYEKLSSPVRSIEGNEEGSVYIGTKYSLKKINSDRDKVWEKSTYQPEEMTLRGDSELLAFGPSIEHKPDSYYGDNWVRIDTCPELQGMEEDLDGKYYLSSNINCSATENWNSGSGFDPIGGGYDPGFGGVLDGNNYAVIDIYMIRDFFGGLFSHVKSNAEVKNLRVTKGYLKNDGGDGGLLSGFLNGEISKVVASGVVKGNGDNHGGLTGSPYEGSKISHSYGNVKVEAVRRSGIFASGTFDGGLINNSYSYGYTNNIYDSPDGFAPSSVSVDDGYWDLNKAGTSSSRSGTALTTDEMTYPNSSSYMDFNFGQVWVSVPELNNGYPVLINNTPNLNEVIRFSGTGSSRWTDFTSDKALYLGRRIILGDNDSVREITEQINRKTSGTYSSGVISPGSSKFFTAVRADVEALNGGNATVTVKLSDDFSANGAVYTQEINLTRGENRYPIEYNKKLSEAKVTLTLEGDGSRSPVVNSLDLLTIDDETGGSGQFDLNAPPVETAGAAKDLKVNVTTTNGIEGSSTSSNYDVRIQLQNESATSQATGTSKANPGETVDLSVKIPEWNINASQANVSSVTAQVTMPNGTMHNVTGMSVPQTGGVSTSTYSNTPILGTYDVRYFAELTSGFKKQVSSTTSFEVENITVPLSLTTRSVLSGDSITVSGSGVKKYPDDTVVGDTLKFYRDVGYGENFLKDVSVSGSYSSTASAQVAGTHRLIVNVTNPDGITGFNSETFNVSLQVSNQNATFSQSDTKYLDVERGNHDLNISTLVSNSTDSEVASVNATVTLPDDSTETVELGNTTYANSTGIWDKVVDTTSLFGDVLGRYNVTFDAVTDRGIGSNTPDYSFYIENISITENLSDVKVDSGQSVDINGSVELEPYSEVIENEVVNFYTNDTSAGSATTGTGAFNDPGVYTGSLEAPVMPGYYSFKVNVTNENSIFGVNTKGLKVYELNATIHEALQGTSDTSIVEVFKDNESDTDLTFNDTLKANASNPGALTNVRLDYSVPSEWTANSIDSAFGTLGSGSSVDNDPGYDIGPDATRGEIQVNATATAAEGVSDKTNFTVEIFTKPEISYVNPPSVVSRLKSYKLIPIKVVEQANGQPIENLAVNVSIDGPRKTSGRQLKTNASGIAEYNWTLSSYSTGRHTFAVTPRKDRSRHVDFDSAPVKLTNIDITGFLRKDSFSITQPTMYRDDDRPNSSTVIELTADDDTESQIQDAEVNVRIANTTKTAQTDSAGDVSFTYNPKDGIDPGNYTVHVNATKGEDFEPLEFNSSVEIRGVLQSQIVEKPAIATNGLSWSLASSVSNETGGEIPVNINWTLNGSEIGTQKNFSWIPEASRGVKELKLKASKPYYDNSNSSTTIQLYELVDIDTLQPDNLTFRTGSNITARANLTDANSSEVISDFPVKFKTGAPQETNLTDTNGSAIYTFQKPTGNYTLNATIQDNASMRYNVSQDKLQRSFEVDNETYIENFELEHDSIFNNQITSPTTTDITFDLSQSSYSGTPVPASGVNVSVNVNNTVLTCETVSDGSCTVNYDAVNPTQAPVGEKKVNFSVDRTGWSDVSDNDTLVVKGFISEIDVTAPSGNKIIRGQNNNLDADITDSAGDSIDIAINWTLDGTQVASGKGTQSWTPSGTAKLGPRTLTATAGGRFYNEDSTSKPVAMYGESYVDFDSPDNDSEIGYGETPTITCRVTNDVQGVKDYPVEFTQNGSTFAESTTGGSGYASANWDVPNQISTFDIGCQISDNATLYHDAVEILDSRRFVTKDDVPPSITDASLSDTTVQPGNNATLTFNASDGVGIKQDGISVNVIEPNGFPETYQVQETASGYSAEIETGESLRGTYKITISAEDTSGNVGKKKVNLVADPGGSISVAPESKSLENITVVDNQSIQLVSNFTADMDTFGLNISASSTQDFVELNTTSKECGAVANGSSCLFTVEATVQNDTSPSTSFIDFEANWSDGQKYLSVSNFSTIEVERNPEFKVERQGGTGEWSTTIFHGDSGAESFNINSTGNYRIDNYQASFEGDTLDESWVTLRNASKERMNVGDTRTTQVEVAVPTGTSPGTYTGTLYFNSTNSDENRTRDVSVTVSEDQRYTVSKSSITQDVAVGTNGTLSSVDLNMIGNVPLTVTTSFTNFPNQFSTSGFTLPKQERKELVINYSDITVSGTYTTTLQITTGGANKEVDLTVEAVSFSPLIKTSDTEVETNTGDYEQVKYNVTEGDQLVTENLSHEIRVGGLKANISSVEEDSGVFTANFSIPEVPDARTHDVVVEVMESSRGIVASSRLEDKFRIPDKTPPTIDQIETRNIEPGENITINISASDNAFQGISDISMDLELPNGTTREYNVSESAGAASKELNLTLGGDYKVTAYASDTAGFNTSQSAFFRVSGPVQVSGDFRNASDKPIKSEISFINPNSDSVVSKINTSNSDANYSTTIPSGEYNVKVEFSDNTIDMNSVSINGTLNNFLRADEMGQVDANSPGVKEVMAIGVDTAKQPDSAQLKIDYSDYEQNIGNRDADKMKVARCSNYNFSTRTCNGPYSSFEPDSIDSVADTVTVSVPGFSQYTLYFEEQETNDTQDNQTQDNETDDTQDDTQETDDSGDTGGGGGGGGGGLTQEELEETLDENLEQEEMNQSQYAEFGSDTISARLKPGESRQVSISIRNNYNSTQEFEFTVDEVLREFVSPPNATSIQPQETRDVIVNLSVPPSQRPSSYTGRLTAESNQVSNQIPVNLQILPPDKKLLDLSVTPVFDNVEPGGTLRVETAFNNQGYARNVDVTATIELNDPNTNETLSRVQRTFAVGTTLTKVVELNVPEDAERKQYEIRGTARYTNLDIAQTATAVSTFNVQTPFWQRTILGLTYANLGIGFFVLIITSLSGYGIYQYRRKKIIQKKRYMEQIDLDTIPQGGNRQAFVGEIAEMGRRTFVDVDDLTTHALVAGATGSGKTVTGQVMVEEALEEGVNVIVLDPTAQWTGFLRENQEPDMMQLYDKFGMSREDAEAFDGNIRAVEPEQEEIDITPYLNNDEDGEIIVFSMHKMDSANIDEFVDHTIQQVFDENLPERNELETLIVYDEVHRLLDKFGGSGQGLKQLERGAREFRKWGVGMVLVSQVISDFSGEIRANIGTTVQMRTEYEADLDRLKDKFGMDTVRSVAKAEVGSGMLQSSDYNHGRPYFVDFRPLLHSPHRLSDEELDKYESYNRRIDRLEQRIDELEEQGEQVYEHRSELKLAKRNLRKGSFNLVDIYLDELEENVM